MRQGTKSLRSGPLRGREARGLVVVKRRIFSSK